MCAPVGFLGFCNRVRVSVTQTVFTSVSICAGTWLPFLRALLCSTLASLAPFHNNKYLPTCERWCLPFSVHAYRHPWHRDGGIQRVCCQSRSLGILPFSVRWTWPSQGRRHCRSRVKWTAMFETRSFHELPRIGRRLIMWKAFRCVSCQE